MNNKFIAAILLCFVFISCNKERDDVAPASQPGTESQPGNSAKLTPPNGSVFIGTNVANDMISSYLYSISSHYGGNGSDVKSFTIDADSMRAYLADTSIKEFKVMFAHTQAYMAGGNTGKPAGYQCGALTLVIAGFNSNGDYVYHNGQVLDHVAPCPYSCPPGQAGSDLLQ
ncbi:MAG: hypothetical protein V4649_11670 [Bacteroidota bacterium]